MRKRLFSFIIAAVFMLSGCIAAYGAEAPADVRGGVYERAVNTLLGLKIVSGYEDGSFRPGVSVNRAEACAMVVRYMEADEADLKGASQNTFPDMGDPEHSWAKGYVNYAVSEGIVKGYSDGTFRPGARVTYEELAAMLVNAMGYDSPKYIGTWPSNYVNLARKLGLFEQIAADKIGEFAANRGDAALMVYNAYMFGRGTATGESHYGKVGDKITNHFFEFTVKSVIAADELNEDVTTREGYKFVVADITVKNTWEGESPIPVGNYDFSIRWKENGNIVEDMSFEKFMDGMYPDDTTLDYGRTLSGTMVFEVPAAVSDVEIFYTERWDDDFTGDTYVVKCQVK